MKKRLFLIVATMFSFFASSLSASACYYGLYQPEEPQSLREE